MLCILSSLGIFIVSTSAIFMMVKHPLSLGGLLLVQTTLVSLMISLTQFNCWYSYMMFLIMVGGMLILFMYMTSIASNEKFKYSNKIYMTGTVTISLSLIFLSLNDQFMQNMNNLFSESIMETNNLFNFTLNKFTNWPANLIYSIVIVYLLITMIAVVKMISIKHGPLRNMD
uniref:NADH-ubiquinone oxidoreductase chain 6 n=1 Tax=Ceruchus minor TaxID=617564 RepID=A0A7L4VE33_9SCAR|nr:NADH dehydrogenase subunit 6 [Ceruchus minor]